MKKKELLQRIEELEKRVASLEAGRYIYMPSFPPTIYPLEERHPIWTVQDDSVTISWGYNNASNTD